MKILITTDLYTTETNGVVTSVKNLSAALIRRGHDVRILTLSEKSRSYRLDNIYFIRSLPLGVIYPDVRMPSSYRHRLIKELIEWKPEVIHSQCEFFTMQFASYIAKHTGAPIVHTYHTLYEQYFTYLLPVERMAEKSVAGMSRMRLKSVQRIIAPTRKVEATLRSYGLEVPISVVPSGVDLSRHSRRLSEAERAQRRRELGIGDTDRVLLNLGRLGTEKNLGELLEFFSRLEEEKLKFLIVGDGPAREDLQKQAENLGISHRVIFTGMVPQAMVQSYYQLGDIFVSASTSETQGLTYIEAAANGLCLLCRQDPCLTDVLRPGENGFAYTREAEFREGLQKILADDTWRNEASRRSEQIAAAFGIEAFGEAVEAIYCQVTGKEQKV